MTRILAFVILIFLGGILPAAQEGVFQRLQNENCELYALDQEDIWHLTLLIRLCSQETDALLKTSLVPQKPLSFFALKREFEEREFTGSSVAVPLDEPVQRTLWRIFRALLQRRMRERLNTRAHDNASFALLAAALANRVIYCGIAERGFYQPDFRIPRRQFQKRQFPRINDLLTSHPPVESELLFRLYMVHANLLLDILEGTTRDLPGLLDAWWDGECRQKLPSAEALRNALPPGSLDGKSSLQSWYEQNAYATVQKRTRDNSTENIREQLEEILTISFLSADSQDGILRVQLEQLPEMLKDYKPNATAIRDIQNRLLSLLGVTPPLLQDAVSKYLLAVDALRQHNLRDFREFLHQAREEFGQASERQNRADAILLEEERTRQNRQRMTEWGEILNHQSLRPALDKILY